MRTHDPTTTSFNNGTLLKIHVFSHRMKATGQHAGGLGIAQLT